MVYGVLIRKSVVGGDSKGTKYEECDWGCACPSLRVSELIGRI